MTYEKPIQVQKNQNYQITPKKNHLLNSFIFSSSSSLQQIKNLQMGSSAFKLFSFPYLMMVLIIIILVCNIDLHDSVLGNTNMVLHQEFINGDHYNQSIETSSTPPPLESDLANYSRNRKLLANEVCTKKDISISQSKDSSSSGIPQYIVQIVNTCMSSCAPSQIHVNCGWFASAKMVNPKIFKRLSHDDCLVNDGRTLENSQIIRFTYSNSFMYPLSFRSASFC